MQTLIRQLLRVLAVVAAVATALPAAQAQTDPQFTQYYEVPTFYNPAAAGRTDLLRIRGGGRLQWLGVDNAPRSFVLSGDMPLRLFDKRWAVGLVAVQESQGLYSTLSLGAQIGYKLKKWGGEFTGALQIGMYDQKFKGSEVYIPDDDDFHEGSDDAIPMQDVHGTAFDLGLGLWYEHKRWWAGLSCTHLMSPTITMSADGGSSASSGSTERNFEFTARRTLYFMAGYNIPIKNTLFELIPSVLVKSDFDFTGGEITARARYNRFISFGVGYRYNDAVTATLSAEFKGFFAGYAFDYSTSAIGRASSGSHELFLGYSLKLDLGDKNKNKHKSIRIL